MTSLALRARAEEQMDDPALDPDVYAQVLRDLARVNKVTLAPRPTLDFLRRAAAGMERFRLLDIGFGHGDMLRRIARWTRRRGVEVELIGVDLNPRSQRIARAATPAGLAIEYRTGDYREVEEPLDFVVSSLVAHHMSEAELIHFLRFMEEQAGRGWLINDLHRHAFAFHTYPLLARVLGVHRIVREDGRLSIARAFRPGDWRALLAQAGVPVGAARIVRRFPFRLCVERLR